MDEKEKYFAEIESRMHRFNETIAEIATKAQKRNADSPEVDIEGLRQKHQDASQTIAGLKSAEDDNWEQTKTSIDRMLGDIDQDLRSALAYYS